MNYKAVIEVYTRNIGETISIRLRLFHEQGFEMPMLNMGYDIDNDWDFYFKGNHYQVYIKEITSDESSCNDNAKNL